MTSRPTDRSAVDPAAAPVRSSSRIPAPSGIESIDRIFRNMHPVAERYLHGEATEEELFQVPGMDRDSGVTMEETVAWLRNAGLVQDQTG